ncbi:uncharacterized protein LOC107481552 [Arachis duranensis]|uniref:GRF-type domain-containing protein n=2 Tax=Arachis TaxID=3817 RepID=A0A444ZTW8_ARAHY|nr:uncharacterized protein LOC107481552 [Arachis duranensis]RYR17596.1 hypothetical protein Ahy_B03g062303 [Arachis hypogaea]
MGSSNPSGGKKVKFQHSKCKCGSYAIMQGSATAKNPDRIFLGCCHYRTERPHCNYFMWLDELIFCHFAYEEDIDVNERMLMLENKFGQLEHNVGLAIEGNSKKWSIGFRVYVMVAMLIVLAVVKYVVL